MSYNVFDGTLNLAQFNPVLFFVMGSRRFWCSWWTTVIWWVQSLHFFPSLQLIIYLSLLESQLKDMTWPIV